MSKTIWLSFNQETIKQEGNFIRIDDDILSETHKIVKNRRNDLPKLWKMVVDFYGDYTFDDTCLLKLKIEVDSIINNDYKISVNTRIFLGILLVLCDIGIKENLILFVIAD